MQLKHVHVGINMYYTRNCDITGSTTSKASAHHGTSKIQNHQ